jgi:hypothetical protein
VLMTESTTARAAAALSSTRPPFALMLAATCRAFLPAEQ